MKIIDNGSMRRFVVAAALSTGLGLGTHSSAQGYSYPVSYLIDLNTRTAASLGNVQASAINDAGQVAGTNSNSHAFITGPNGVGMTDLGTLGGNESSAYGINAVGQVVGWSDTSNSGRHAFITGPNGVGMTDLGTLGGNGSLATGINSAGQVVGYSYDVPGPVALPHAFITGRNGVGMADLGTPGGVLSEATGINAAGQVTGFSSGSELRAFITGPNGMGMTDLGTLGGSRSYANGVNAAGEVVGWSDAANFGWLHAFITGPNGVGMTDLGTLGKAQSEATGINAAGQVGGYYGYHEGAFITGPNGIGMSDLNSLVDLPAGARLEQALAINDMGQVVAIGGISLVPEPASYALMLAGLALISVMSRRKQKG